MIENFFQERFSENLKFYEGKTQEELEKNYQYIYEGLEIKDIFMTEIASIKKLLLSEKEIRNEINFDDFIESIDEFYEIIENISDEDLKKNEEIIKLIIVSAKLSLNSPIYIKVDVEKLRNFILNNELSQFINDNQLPNKENQLLKSFKTELEKEFEENGQKIKKYIDFKKECQKKIEKLEELYWQISDPYADIFSLMGRIFSDTLLENNEKKILLEIINKLVQYPTKENVEQLNKQIGEFAKRIKKNINENENTILQCEYSQRLIKYISKCIDKEGKIVQTISNELIEQFSRQILCSNLNILQLQYEILKEQSHAAKRQMIGQLLSTIETRKKALTKKVMPTRNKNEIEMSNYYKEILDTAQEIVDLELNGTEKDKMTLDELEELFVGALKDEQLNKETIKATIEKDANSDLCRLKFIVHGLNYQIGNLDQKNLTEKIELIKMYLEYYNKYKRQILDEEKKQNEYTEILNERTKYLEDIIALCKNEETFLNDFTEEQQRYLEAYMNVKLKDDAENNQVLTKLNLDSSTVMMYKIFKILDNTTKETKEFIELLKEEKITTEDMKQINEKIGMINELKKQFEEAKEQYESNQKMEKNQPNEEISNNRNDENILIFFEAENGITEVEKRIIEDSKRTKYTQTDISNTIEMLKRLRQTSPNQMRFTTDSLDKIIDTSGGYKVRKLRQSEFRIIFYRLNSSGLKTDKPVYMVITAGKKASDDFEMYDFTKHIKGEVLKYEQDLYEKFKNATPEEIKAFFEKQIHHEKKIIEAAQNGKGAYDGNTGFRR